MGSNDRKVIKTDFLHENERDFLAALGSCRSIESVAKSSGVSTRVVAGALRSLRIMLQANDGAVDDFLELVENWNAAGLDGFLLAGEASSDDDYVRQAAQQEAPINHEPFARRKQAVIEEIERSWSSKDMRYLGAALIRLADALDQDWNPEHVQFTFNWPSMARKIEQNAVELANKARLIKGRLDMRKKYLPEAALGEPPWNILLELFCQFAEGASVSTKSLCIAAECPDSTALRHIERLEEVGLIRRSRSRSDLRVTLVELTEQGVVGVGRVLERFTV